MDQLRRLEMFVRAAEAGSFARAAQLLRIDPSTVSHAIASLEKRLQLTLFYRTTRQLSLTQDGQEIFRRAREIITQIDQLDVRSSAGRRLSGTLRVGIAVPISRTVIMPRLPEFMQRHPDLELEWFVITQIKDMHAGGFDVMLRAGTPPDSSLIARKLAEMRFGVYGAPQYLQAAGEPVDPNDLARHRCLVHKPPVELRAWDEWEFERASERRVVKVPRSLVTDDREGMIDAVLAGAGLMRIGMFNPALITSGHLRRVLADWQCLGEQPIYALYRNAATIAPKLAAFLSFVNECFAAFDPGQVTLMHKAPLASIARRSERRSGR